VREKAGASLEKRTFRTHTILLPDSAGSRSTITGSHVTRLANDVSAARVPLRDKKTSEPCHFAAEDSLVTKMHAGNEPSAAMSVF
jgi:hypothetical protein